MQRRFTCESCHARAFVEKVKLRSNLGFVIQHRTVELDARLCRRCIRGYFWQFTLLTLGLGWWGAYSFLYTLHALPRNVHEYLRTRHLPESGPGRVHIDHFTGLRWLYGALFTGVGAICAVIATQSTDIADRHATAQGALLLLPGLVLLAINVVRSIGYDAPHGERRPR